MKVQIFATRVWGFGFTKAPIATFGSQGHVNRLLRLARRGDRLLFVGTKTERTDTELQGRLLGMGEIGFESFRTLEVMDRADLDDRDFDDQGRYKFPHAVAIVRAWRFLAKPLLTEYLTAQLTMIATPGVEQLSDEDARRVLTLEAEEINLPELPALQRMRRVNEILRPTTGPRPTDATYEVTRSAQERAWTYLLRFGKRNIWKVGHTQDVRKRVDDVNLHVPTEILDEQWTAFMIREWPDSQQAYDMEQRVLRRLQAKRTGFERVQCTENEVVSVWATALTAEH